jgi:hypothetical protein
MSRPTTPILGKFQTPPEHTKVVGRCVKTLYRWMALPDDPLTYFDVNGQRLLTVETTLAWLERRKVERRPEPRRRGRPPRAA